MKIELKDGTAIEWADYTFNPWWGCTKVAGSRACVNCYAAAFAKRTGHQVWGARAPRRPAARRAHVGRGAPWLT